MAALPGRGRGSLRYLFLLAVLAGAGCGSQVTTPDDPAVAPWIDQLQTGNPAQREEAIAALAAAPHPTVVTALLTTAQFDNQRHLRVAALRALAAPELGTDPAPLVRLLDDPDAEIRAVTCETLGTLQAVAAEQALAGRLRDPQPIVRIAAVHALNRLGPSGVARIDRLLSEGRLEDRITVAEVAGQTGDHSRVPMLVASLKADEDPLRRAAAEALGKLKSPDAIAPLVELIRHPLSEAAVAAILARADQPPTRPERLIMVGLLDEMQIAAGRSPGGMNDHAWVMNSPPTRVQHLMPRVVKRQRDDAARAVRRVAATALVEIGGPAELALIDLLADADTAMAEAVSEVLTTGDQPADALYVLLADANRPADARLRALDLLLAHLQRPAESLSQEEILDAFEGRSRAPIRLPLPGGRLAARVVPLDERLTAILKAGLTDADVFVRLRFAGELAQRRVPEAADALVVLVNENDPTILQPALAALAVFNDTRAVPRLLQLLKDPKAAALHAEVIAALAASRDRRATDALLSVALGSLPRQADAIRALGVIGDPKAGPPLFELFQKSANQTAARAALITAIAACQVREAVPVFIKLLEAGAGKEDEALMNALGALGDPAAYDAILRGIARGKYHPRGHTNHLALAGINALVRIGDARAVPYLEGLVRQPPDPATREYAASGLGRFPRAEAIHALIRLLVDERVDPGVKEAFVAPAIVAQGVAAKPHLMKLLLETPAPATGRERLGFDPGIYAAQLLAEMGPEALPELQQAVHGAPKHLLARITEAAGKIADDRAIEILTLIARHDDPLVRQWAVVALGRSRQAAAVSALQTALNDPHSEVVRWTRWGLEQHGVRAP
jgi:HEAT repeat protein